MKIYNEINSGESMKKNKKVFYGWFIVFGGVIIMAFATPMINNINTLFVVPISNDLGVSRSIYIISNTITSIACIIASIIFGRIINSKNLKKIQIFSTIILAFSYGSYAFAKNIQQIYIAAFFMGFSYMAAGMIPASIIVTNWFHKKRGLAISIVLAGIGIGAAILSTIINTLMLQYSWQVARIVIALMLVVVTMPVILFVMKDSPEKMGLKPYGYELTEKQSEADTDYDAGDNIPLEMIMKNRFTYLFIVGVIGSGIVCGGAMQNLGPFFTDIYSSVFASMIISLYSFTSIFGKLILGWLSDRFGNIVSLLFGCITFGTSFILMSFYTQSIVLMALAAILFGIGYSIGSVNLNLITLSIYGKINYSKMLSYSKSIQHIGMGIGPLLFSTVYDRTNSYKIVWVFSLLVTIIVFITLSISCIDSIKLRLNYSKVNNNADV